MGLGLPEIIFILVIALLIFGPKRLPEISRTIGKGMAEFRKATNDLKNTLSTELTVEDSQPARPRRVDLANVVPGFTPPAARPAPADTVPYQAEAVDPADPAVAAGSAGAAEAGERVASAWSPAEIAPAGRPATAGPAEITETAEIGPADPDMIDPIQPS